FVNELIRRVTEEGWGPVGLWRDIQDKCAQEHARAEEAAEGAGAGAQTGNSGDAGRSHARTDGRAHPMAADRDAAAGRRHEVAAVRRHNTDEAATVTGAFSAEVGAGSAQKMRPAHGTAFSAEVGAGSAQKMR